MPLLTIKLLWVLLLIPFILSAKVQIIKKENHDSNTTLLVIAGIHGNEPGSYFAASILAKHYTVHSKNLWIVPNLNEKSIQNNLRGLYGDMNRKFSFLQKNDKDAKTIKDIKELILSQEVSLVLNLHDGHGFYRKDFQGNIFNPNAWGQTCVIDQCQLNQNQPFGNLNAIASQVRDNINKVLLQDHHAFDVRNTKTKFEDEQMQLSLTYFAVTNNKPAFAIESSKNLSSLAQKVYYQLLAIENFMKIMGIEFTKDFILSEKKIDSLLKDYGFLTINNNILLNLSSLKKSLSYVPIQSKDNNFTFSHLLGSVKDENGLKYVFIGNKKVTVLKPQYFETDPDCPKEINVEVDDKPKILHSASYFIAKDNFKIAPKDGIRVNVIGYTSKGVDNESGIKIHRNSLMKRYSIDNESESFRIEFYKNNKFCSMSVVQFK